MADDPVTTAMSVLGLARAGDFETIREMFVASLQSMVSADALRASWAAELDKLGPITGVGAPITEPAGNGVAAVKLPVTFERGERTIVVAVAAGGRLGGLQMAPAEAAAPIVPWEPPPYADPGSFDEHDVLDGYGTLSVPRGPGPWPAVVLLPGSGPNDRDGTLGRNKPLKDVAWGLASRGVAVLRFDKITYGRRAEQARRSDFTPTDEYVPDALAAIELLREQRPNEQGPQQGSKDPRTVEPETNGPGATAQALSRQATEHPAADRPAAEPRAAEPPAGQPPAAEHLAADPPAAEPPAAERPAPEPPTTNHPAITRIFVLGHSLGGTVAPRVAQAAPDVAGLILLGGGAEPLHRAALRQVRYLAGLNPATAATTQPMVDALTRQAAAVDSPDLSTATAAADLPFGVPAAYWLDLRDYDPAALAATLGKPILILQGGRDYQVTVADDLARWQTGLADQPDVTVHVYDADNHAFFPGAGPSTPAEYEPAQHVDPQVIADIAAWISRHGTTGSTPAP
jgi:dienelactone hydrolase